MTCAAPAAAGQRGEAGGVLGVEAEGGWAAEVPAHSCHLVNERDDTLDDLVKSDYLHEAGCGPLQVRGAAPACIWHSRWILARSGPVGRSAGCCGESPSRLEACFAGKLARLAAPAGYEYRLPSAAAEPAGGVTQGKW